MNEEKIQNCIDQIESCEFECEGGPLRMNMGWIYLLMNIQQLQDALNNACDTCGATPIDDCKRCGAPVCCPQCCNIDWLKRRLEDRETIIRESITALDVEPASVLPSSLPNEVARLRQKLVRALS